MLRSIALKTMRDQRHGMVGWTIGFVGVVLMYAAFYPSIVQNAHTLNRYLQNLPEAFRGFFGNIADFSSPTGYVQTEMFSVFIPLLLLVYAIGSGARATAGEEERQTLDLLLSTPTTRRRVVLEKFEAMLAGAGWLCAIVWASIAALGPIWDLRLDLANLAAASFSLFLLAIAFGSAALAIGCLWGSRGLATGITSAIAAATYVVNGLAPSVEALKPFRILSPFYHYLGADPLRNGLDPVHASVLAGIALVLLVVSLVAFERRDLAT